MNIQIASLTFLERPDKDSNNAKLTTTKNWTTFNINENKTNNQLNGFLEAGFFIADIIFRFHLYGMFTINF